MLGLKLDCNSSPPSTRSRPSTHPPPPSRTAADAATTALRSCFAATLHRGRIHTVYDWCNYGRFGGAQGAVSAEWAPRGAFSACAPKTGALPTTLIPTQSQPSHEGPAQCSLKRGRTQAHFRKKFLSDGMLQHKIL